MTYDMHMQNGHLAWERGSFYIFIEEGRGQRFLILRMVLLITNPMFEIVRVLPMLINDYTVTLEFNCSL